jgi:hypothetical protein
MVFGLVCYKPLALSKCVSCVGYLGTSLDYVLLNNLFEAKYFRLLMNPICVSNQILQTDSQIHETTPKIDVDYQEAHKQKWRDFFLYI